MINKELFQFLADLKDNNHKDWFTDNKKVYQQHQETVKGLFIEIQDQLNHTDQIEAHKLYRIYRDVRFSKDKTPYKTWFSGYLSRLKPALRGGYYLHLEDGKSMIGGGFYAPNKEDLKRIRDEFTFGDDEIRGIINDTTFKKYFGTLEGEGVKTAPKGFDKNDPAIEFIRKKQFYAMRHFTNDEVMSENFVEEVVKTYQALRPFFDYMSNVLTTDLNGESII
ncbi:DUF2461 domain-containing protein [Flammeovirga pacifica]|uniref:TIGR02453 family protein n=1 Tax=Flammeovirga pacifica TaxID=915059 RepID=A0A1S1YVK3_FLAPC|nr:DUF2461 domain-containing protein [Flammeovirga pacifica]OHX65047.1 TIGR02453 family protein [Flammeovirga pacifica]